MKRSDKDPSKGTSFWGMVFSIVLHASVIVLILFWGFKGVSEHSGSSGPIQVSLSSLDTGQGNKAPAKKAQTKTKKAEPKKVEKKPATKKAEKKKEVKKEEVKAPPEPPKKKEEPKKEDIKKVEKKEEPKKDEKPKEEPKKEEKPKEAVKKEPEKKEVVPLEPEKKEEKKVAEKPKPTEKPKPKKKEKKAQTPPKKKSLDKERSRVLKDIQRQKVLDQLGSSEEPDEPEEPMGEEQKLAMADAEDAGLETRGPTGGSNGSSSVSPVIINLYSQQVHRKISRNWRIPPSVPTDGGLATDLLFKVGQDGKIYDVRVSKSSGNPVFDEYCINAIYKSAPLPPPPSELKKEAKDKGIIITFRNEP
jgi:TolA protein